MRITKRYRHFLLPVLYVLLPFALAAQEAPDSAASGTPPEYVNGDLEEMRDSLLEEDQDNAALYEQQSQEVKTHSLWDNSVPVNVDSTEEWWVNGGLVAREVPATTMEKLKADKDLQYDKKEERSQRNNWIFLFLMGIVRFLQSIRLLIILLLVGGLLFMILFFMRQQGFRFSRRAGEAEMPGVEEIDPGVEGYEKQVQEAINGGHFRQAVRFLHLQALRLLAERQLISLSKDKTNADYLRVLRSTQWYQPFSRLTRDYEYIWYGDVHVNAAQFDRIHGQFRQFINELGYTR